MGDVWIFGPFMVQEKWGLYVIAFIVSYIVVRLAITFKSIDRSVLDKLWNALFLFLVVWKLSYALFHPIEVFKNPISQVYFTGGEKGIVFALIAVLIYFFWISKKQMSPFRVFMEVGLVAMLTAIGVYQTIAWVLYYPGSYHLLFEAVLTFGIVTYWFITYKIDNKPLWPILLLWFSLGELFLSYFKPQIPVWINFSFLQLVYIGTILVAISISFITDRPDTGV